MAGGAEPEDQIGLAIPELKMSLDLKPQLRDLHITHDFKMEFNNMKATAEAEGLPEGTYPPGFAKKTKFSGKYVVFIGEQRILPNQTSRSTRACIR